MGFLTANYWWRVACSNFSSKTHVRNTLILSGNPSNLIGSAPCRYLELYPEVSRARIMALASRKSARKLKRNKEARDEASLGTSKSLLDDYNGVKDEPSSGRDVNSNDLSSVKNGSDVNSVNNGIPSRSNVLQACALTSGLIAALGLAIRQVSHVASVEGLPILDCSQVSFSFEIWHLKLIAGLVVLISMSRYTLLRTWPDFAESSEAANKQVLTSLQPSDYLIVAFLPGIGEELLFRGGLLPLVGLNWKGALAVAALFGVLHLGSGRKSSFAIWATFVGLVYGYATITTSSIVVPMASHALNNLIGGALWRLTSGSSEETSN